MSNFLKYGYLHELYTVYFISCSFLILYLLQYTLRLAKDQELFLTVSASVLHIEGDEVIENGIMELDRVGLKPLFVNTQLSYQ